MASDATIVATVATGLQFPEGMVFVGNTLYFVDNGSSDVFRLVGDKVQKVWHQDGCGANGLVQVGNRLLVACYDNGTIAEITVSGQLVGTIRSDDAGLPFLSPNDLTADRKGGVYFTASGSGATLGKVYYRGVDGHVREVASDIRYANGLVVSLDGTHLYLAESAENRLLIYAIGADAGLSDRQPFIKLGDLLAATSGDQAFTPDGVRIDRHGNLFVALYRGGGFAVFSANGKLIKMVQLPASHHTSLAIAPDRKFVFVTAIYDQPGGGSRGELLKVPNPVAE
ncbi:MAG TPA: SMP-30/gluconolactonase/LRE family protein [Paraburkholderia sp.]